MTLYYDIKALEAAVEKKNVDLILIVSKKIYTEA